MRFAAGLSLPLLFENLVVDAWAVPSGRKDTAEKHSPAQEHSPRSRKQIILARAVTVRVDRWLDELSALDRAMFFIDPPAL